MTNNLKLSSAEILSLWNVYLMETMTTYVTEYFLAKAKDKEVIKMLEFALQLSQEGVSMSSAFFNNADHPLPQGFTEEDVNMEVPIVYSDNLMILIKNKLAQDALVIISMH